MGLIDCRTIFIPLLLAVAVFAQYGPPSYPAPAYAPPPPPPVYTPTSHYTPAPYTPPAYTTAPAYPSSYPPPHPPPSRYKREPADYYDKPSKAEYDKKDYKDDYKKEGYGGGGGGYKQGYSVATGLYWVPTQFTEYVIDLKGKDGGTYEPDKPWKADCNGYSYGYKYGWLTAIWDDYDFKDLDYLKCEGPKPGDDYDKYGGYKLDLYDAKVIEFPAYKSDSYGKGDYSSYKTECPKGYLLTALWAGDYEFKSLKYGKCVRLESGLVAYSTCDNIATDYKQGGTYEAYKVWNVECPSEWAAVGLKRGEYDKIEYMRCCKLVPPHPPSKYPGNY